MDGQAQDALDNKVLTTAQLVEMSASEEPSLTLTTSAVFTQV